MDSRPQNREKTREDTTRHEHNVVRRAPSGADREWPAGGHGDTRTPKRRTAIDASAAEFSQGFKGPRADRFPESFRDPHVNREAGLEYQLGCKVSGGRSNLPTDIAPEGCDAQDPNKQPMLWDSLREALSGLSDKEGVLGRGTIGRPFGGAGLRGEDISCEEDRRRLIEQAIAVLLEDSEEEEFTVKQRAL